MLKRQQDEVVYPNRPVPALHISIRNNFSSLKFLASDTQPAVTIRHSLLSYVIEINDCGECVDRLKILLDSKRLDDFSSVGRKKDE
jgi:hypothetical protein